METFLIGRAFVNIEFNEQCELLWKCQDISTHKKHNIHFKTIFEVKFEQWTGSDEEIFILNASPGTKN